MLKKIFLFAFLAGSCAVEQTKHEVSIVEFDPNEKETITISEKVNTEYGPAPEGDRGGEPQTAQRSDKTSGTAKPAGIVAIDLFPALYNSLGYVSTFAELEKSKVKVSIVSASGFSSVVAALYAKHEASNMVEWKTFELYQLLADKKPFGEDWTEVIYEFLNEEFGDLKLSQLKKLLVIPSLRKNGTMVFDANKEVVAAIMETLNISGGSSMLAGGNYSYLGALKKFGADHVLRVSFLPKKIGLKHPDGFVFGIYSRLAGKAGAFKNNRGFYIFDGALTGDIDSFNNLSDTIYQTKDENAFFAKETLSRVEESSGKI